MNVVVVALGGALGAALRYLCTLFPLREPFLFPVKTFFVNVLGCLAIALIAALSARHSLSPRFVLFLKTGVCGGFTTFSTFALETSVLLKSGHGGIAALYVLLSVILGIGVIFLVDALFAR